MENGSVPCSLQKMHDLVADSVADSKIVAPMVNCCTFTADQYR